MSSKKKMLALVTDAYGAGGGIAQYNRDFLGAVAATGDWSIDVLPRIARSPNGPTPAGIRQRPPLHSRLSYSLAALSLANRVKPDVVFCGHLFMTPIALVVSMMFRAQLLLQLHGREVWIRPNALVRAAVARVDHISCVSRDTRDKLLTWAEVSSSKITILANTVGEQFVPGDKRESRRIIGIAEEAGPVLLSVGRLASRERYKGQDKVIATLPSLVPDYPELLYLVAGEGDDQPRLSELAHELGVERHVRILQSVPSTDLPHCYRAADLFVLPSTGEGFGIVYLEAMASGTPALGLQAGGAPDALGNGDLGICVPISEFASALKNALDHPPVSGPPLSDAVTARFGRPAFQRAAAMLIRKMTSPNTTTRFYFLV